MSLILSETRLGAFDHGAGERPGVAVTYATSSGEIRRAGTVKAGLGYRIRYEVDISDHRDVVEWQLPSKDEGNFQARIDVGWRVYDPCEITRRHLRDGSQVIHGYLLPALRQNSREHTLEHLHQLEDEINHLVSADAPARLAEGLEIFHLAATLSWDEQTTSHAAAVRALGLEHVVSERAQIDIDTLRRRAVEQLVAGENGLLLHHLTIHQDDTLAVLLALQEENQLSTQARERLLSNFKDRLLPEDLADLAEQMVALSIAQPDAAQLRDSQPPDGSFPALRGSSGDVVGPPGQGPTLPDVLAGDQPAADPQASGNGLTTDPAPLRAVRLRNAGWALLRLLGLTPPQPIKPAGGGDMSQAVVRDVATAFREVAGELDEVIGLRDKVMRDIGGAR